MRQIFAATVLTAAMAVVSCRPGSEETSSSASAAMDANAVQAIAHEAHAAYVMAINSNNLDSLLAVLTDDVVFLAPNSPALAGKAEVRPWAEGYLQAFKTHWEKTTLEFIVAGEWAIERYAYKSTDTPKGGGDVVQDTGKGLNIYHRDADGKWRVARDAWNSDMPLSTM